MLFNSLDFAIFLPIVFAAFWIIPNRFRWVVLLISSYYFYMSWNAKYVFLIFMTTFISYLAGIILEKVHSKKAKNVTVFFTVAVCIGTLFVFKYFNFFVDTVTDIFSMFAIKLHPVTLKLLLPVGISFYTFQTLSYVIDVYRGDIKAEHHFGKYATFVSFFPQLVAGPIERSSNLLPQINKEFVFSYDQASYGIKMVAWGLFKKMVVADMLAIYVDQVYNNTESFNGFASVIAMCFFSVQIYCDFSGYSDIAIGVAKMFNIELMTNFRSPYFSSSVKEFWSRWHISLSTWFRDYIYIPLGGNRCSKPRYCFNILVTFLISGLWHGANITFILWGAMHGFVQMLETLIKKKKKKSKAPFKFSFKWAFSAIGVFIFCTITWVFFRADTISDAIYILHHSLDGIQNVSQYIFGGLHSLSIDKLAALKIAIPVVILTVFDYCNLKTDSIKAVSSWPLVIRWAVYVAFIMMTYMLKPVHSGGEFIYFQF